MEMPETELTATKRPVWNAGRTVGAKRALNQSRSGKSVFTSISAGASEIGHCSIWPSTASFAAVTWCR